MRLYQYSIKIKRMLKSTWFTAMRPLVRVLDMVDSKLAKNRKRRLTEEKALKRVAKCVARYTIRYGPQVYIVATSVDDEYYNESFSGGIRFNWSMLKGRKNREASNKLNLRDTEVQKELLREIENIKGMRVEKVDREYSTFVRLDDYNGTYKVMYQGR